MKPRTKEEAVQIDQLPWKPFPDAFSKGGIRWKLLHVSPEAGAWTAIFDCPAGSSFAAHIHNGPGEYYLTKGKVDIRGGKAAGGDTLIAPGYGYESSNARHDQTHFPVASEFYMTFLGPLTFIKPDGGFGNRKMKRNPPQRGFRRGWGSKESLSSRLLEKYHESA